MAVALLTGGGSRIGAVLAERLASRGHDLILVASDAGRTHAAARSLARRYGVRADVLVADLGSRHGLFRVEALLSGPDAPAVDVLVHDAACEVTVADGSVPSPAQRHALTELGVTATLRLTHAALPGMLRRGTGTVLAVGRTPSSADEGGEPGTVWAAAFTAALTASLAGTGVRAAVVPSDAGPERVLAELEPGGPAAGSRSTVLRDLPRRTAAAGVRAARRGVDLLSDVTRGPLMPPPGPPPGEPVPSAPHRPVQAPGCGHAPEDILAGTAGAAGPVRTPARLPDLPVRPGADRATSTATTRGRSAHFVTGCPRTAEQRSRAAAAARDRVRTRRGAPSATACTPVAGDGTVRR